MFDAEDRRCRAFRLVWTVCLNDDIHWHVWKAPYKGQMTHLAVCMTTAHPTV